MDTLQDLTKLFSRDFGRKQSLIQSIKTPKIEFVFEHKIKNQLEFSMKMLLEKHNTALARNNSIILEIKRDIEETTEIAKNSMVQLEERESMLMDVELE